MARNARVGVPLAQSFGIEPGPMRVESPAADSRMTQQAVALSMARDARLEVLPGGTPVTDATMGLLHFGHTVSSLSLETWGERRG